jgi:hypothetical protein
MAILPRGQVRPMQSRRKECTAAAEPPRPDRSKRLLGSARAIPLQFQPQDPNDLGAERHPWFKDGPSACLAVYEMKVGGPCPPDLDDQGCAARGYVPGVGDPAWNYDIAAG